MNQGHRNHREFFRDWRENARQFDWPPRYAAMMNLPDLAEFDRRPVIYYDVAYDTGPEYWEVSADPTGFVC